MQSYRRHIHFDNINFVLEADGKVSPSAKISEMCSKLILGRFSNSLKISIKATELR